ncbi:MAG: FAD:protein FMN transferase [Alphaproteobacteria bacterium]|nr:FAD:protein FMN transferase [Alphaproteobacteria bacterium]
MRTSKKISIIFVISLIVIISIFKSPYYEYKGFIFNTYYDIRIRSFKEGQGLSHKIETVLEDINRTMSVFRSDSELSKLNQTPMYKEFELSTDLAKVLKKSQEINKLSYGYFDPSISPLIDLWGFGKKTPSPILPSEEQISEVLKYSKFSGLIFSDDFQSVIKTDSRMELNLSAIAKGFAVDKIAELLEEEGFNDYIVEIGGEVRTSGYRNRSGTGWYVGIGVPHPDKLSNAIVLELSNMSVATSGDYRNFIEKEGIRYSHTISPVEGKPVQNKLASVSVFAPTCMEADAYATAIMSMGEDKGLQFANDNLLAVILFIHTQKDKFKTVLSSQAKKILGDQYETD